MKQKLKKNFIRFKSVAKNLLIYQRKTHCHRLWSSVFIDQNGDVYTCCMSEPEVIGNIYKHDLCDIWTKSIRLKIFRFMSLHKCLYCSLRCSMLTREEKESSSHPVIEYPNNVWILYGETCNLSCSMCWQNHRSKITLDNNVLTKNYRLE